MADESPAPPFDGDHGVAHNGADGHAVATGGPAVHNPVDAVFALLHPVEFVIRTQRPLPPVVTMARTSLHSCSSMDAKAWVVRMRPRKSSPGIHPHRQGAQELDEHVKGPNHGSPRLDFTGFHGLAEGCRLQELQSERGQEVDLALSARLVATAARPLHKTGHPLEPADLHDGLHRTEIHPEVQRTGADHRLELPSYSASSTQNRSSLLMLPWCNAMAPARSGLAARIFWYQISDWDRVLVKTNVLECRRMMSTT